MNKQQSSSLIIITAVFAVSILALAPVAATLGLFPYAKAAKYGYDDKYKDDHGVNLVYFPEH